MRPEAFWDEFLEALEQTLATGATRESYQLLVQARLWQTWVRRPQTDVTLFDVREWARHFEGAGWGRLELLQDFDQPRRGDPWLLDLFCRAVLSTLAAGSLRIDGDREFLHFTSPPGFPSPAMKGPLLRRLGWSLALEWREGGVTVPCPEPILSGSSPVDLEALRRTTLNDPEFECELIHTFLAEGQRQFDNLSLRYATNLLHSFKGSAAMVGAHKLTEMLAAEEKQPDPTHLVLLKNEFEAVRDYLQHRLLELNS